MARTSVSFTKCPECGVAIGSQGLPRHRKAAHGVDTAPRQTTKTKGVNKDRLAKAREQGLI